MMTFDVGGETGVHETGENMETSMAVIKDLSSLAALSFADPNDALADLLLKCRIDVTAIDKKVNRDVRSDQKRWLILPTVKYADSTIDCESFCCGTAPAHNTVRFVTVLNRDYLHL